MKQTLQTLKPHLPKIIAAFITLVAIIVIIVIAVTTPKKAVSPTESESSTPVASSEETTPAPSTEPESGLMIVAKPFIIPFESKAKANTDAAGDIHGTFSVVFTIDPTDKDLVIKPTCFSEDGSIKKDGIAFSLIKDGARITGAGLSESSCVVLNHGKATKTAEGYYLVKANTQNTFELIVVNNPVDSGKYSLQITNIGYRRSAKSVSQFFELSPVTLEGLKTNTVSL